MQNQLCTERLNVKEVKKLLRKIGKFESGHTADFPLPCFGRGSPPIRGPTLTMTRNGVHYSNVLGEIWKKSEI